jgi:hypothetical protein
MRKLAVVGVCLLFGLLAGLTLRPDDGTQVSISHPAETGAAVSGATMNAPGFVEAVVIESRPRRAGWSDGSGRPRRQPGWCSRVRP